MDISRRSLVTHSAHALFIHVSPRSFLRNGALRA